MNTKKDFKQLQWDHDVNSYYRYKEIYESSSNDFVKNRCKKKMEAIKIKYPHVFKEF